MKTDAAFDCDVAIIGGGPGGSTSAIYLQQAGYSTIVFEKEIFPRDHVGESLIPFTYYHLKELGVLEEVMKFSTKKPGVNFVDREGLRQSVWCFDRVLNDGAQMSMHMLRAPFDHTLLKRAAQLGAQVLEGSTVRQVDLNDASSATIRAALPDGSEKIFRARFVIDASGQHSFLASQLGGRKSFPGLDRVALFSHWIHTNYDDALKGGLIKIIYLGGDKLGWLWVIPVGRNHLSIGVTLNNAYVKEQKKLLGENWKQELYRQEVAEALALRGILDGAAIEHEIQILGDYSFRVEKKFGSNYAFVGDSGTFLDPIFSSGIYMAMEVARRVAKCIDVKFRGNAEETEATLAREFGEIEDAYSLVEKFVRLFYDPELLHFAHVGSSKHDYMRFVYAYEIFHYMLAGDFFSKSKEYSAFIDTINSERNFNRFIHYIKAQANEFPNEEFCRYSFEEVYGHLPLADRVAPGLLKSEKKFPG